tara:strand:- start:65 stop:475 length:411 start_codon:yes stop_codon:yes gene_type:complete
MKKNELKTMLKPLIKECIKECIFEEGVLSGIITEVAKGMANQRIVAEGLTIESKTNTPDPKELEKKAEALEIQRQERIKKLNENMSFGGVDVFEGTKEILPEGNQHSPLAGTAPDDSGVDISGIMKIANGKWKHLI